MHSGYEAYHGQKDKSRRDGAEKMCGNVVKKLLPPNRARRRAALALVVCVGYLAEVGRAEKINPPICSDCDKISQNTCGPPPPPNHGQAQPQHRTIGRRQ